MGGGGDIVSSGIAAAAHRLPWLLRIAACRPVPPAMCHIPRCWQLRQPHQKAILTSYVGVGMAFFFFGGQLALQYKIDVKKYHFLYLFIEIFVMNVYIYIVS